jgi:peptidoglycan/xylan/chitin deacetylase (PgdA/CDA1 family)
MKELDKMYRNVLGKVPIFMRPPFGSYSPDVLGTLASLGYIVALWSADSGDSTGALFATQVRGWLAIGMQRFVR